MSKKQVCLENKSVGYWSALNGVEVKKIEYGIEDYCVCISRAWSSPSYHKYHRVKIQTTMAGRSYVVIDGYRLYFDECMRIGARDYGVYGFL